LWASYPFSFFPIKKSYYAHITCTDDRIADKIHLGMQHKLRTLTIFALFLSETTGLFFTRLFSSLTAPNLEHIFLDLLVWGETFTWVNWDGFDRAWTTKYFVRSAA
jgi:hypothetical protein